MNPLTMTNAERQEFFDREGYWPVAVVQRQVSPRKAALRMAARLESLLKTRSLKGWRQPLHWTVPPTFENPGLMYTELGHEEFCRQVQDYYAAVRDVHVEQAARLHTRWAIRQILRTFETHVRGFKSRTGKRNGDRAFGTQKWGEGRRVVYQDIRVLPERLMADGRVVLDMDGWLRAYGVRQEELEMAEQNALAQLSRKWGVKT